MLMLSQAYQDHRTQQQQECMKVHSATPFTYALAIKGTDRSVDRLRLSGIEDDGEDDDSERAEEDRISEETDEDSQHREAVELRENALDSLWHTSEGLAKLLRNPKPRKHAWQSLLSIHRGSWANYRALFADRDELVIDLHNVVESLGSEYQWKARAIIVGANATAVLEAFSDVVLHQDDPFAVFVSLDEDFPAPFCPSTDWVENITEEDIDLALDIRTQKLIASLKRLEDDRKIPVDIASDIFCAVEASVDGAESLQHGPYKGIDGRETERFAERARFILHLIENKSVAEAIQRLDEAFPLEGPLDGFQKETDNGDEFVNKIHKWCGKIIDDVKEVLREPALPRESSPTDSLASSEVQDIVRKDVYVVVPSSIDPGDVKC